MKEQDRKEICGQTDIPAGKVVSEKKRETARKNLQKARDSRSLELMRQTQKKMTAVIMSRPPDERYDKAQKAIAARWAEKQANRGMTNEEFREIAAGIPGAEIAEAVGVKESRVKVWRRMSQPGVISKEEAAKIYAFLEERKKRHADQPEEN